MEIMRAGRARWKVENEAFKSLKTFNNLEHSYGHGKNWLGSPVPAIMLPDCLVENGQRLCCPAFQAMRKAFHALRACIQFRYLEGWEDLMLSAAPGKACAQGTGKPPPRDASAKIAPAEALARRIPDPIRRRRHVPRQKIGRRPSKRANDRQNDGLAGIAAKFVSFNS